MSPPRYPDNHEKEVHAHSLQPVGQRLTTPSLRSSPSLTDSGTWLDCNDFTLRWKALSRASSTFVNYTRFLCVQFYRIQDYYVREPPWSLDTACCTCGLLPSRKTVLFCLFTDVVLSLHSVGDIKQYNITLFHYGNLGSGFIGYSEKVVSQDSILTLVPLAIRWDVAWNSPMSSWLSTSQRTGVGWEFSVISYIEMSRGRCIVLS